MLTCSCPRGEKSASDQMFELTDRFKIVHPILSSFFKSP